MMKKRIKKAVFVVVGALNPLKTRFLQNYVKTFGGLQIIFITFGQFIEILKTLLII